MDVKRSHPALHLSRTPLIYVVAQIRFSAIMSMEKFLPDIQERLRHKYPWFNRAKIQEFAFQVEGSPSINLSDRFDFQQRDKRTGVVLSSNAVAFHTNKYATFEAFQEELTAVLGIINEIAGIGLVERIGLRYVDLIRLDAGETWPDYLQAGLLGLSPAAVGVQGWTSAFQSVGQTEVGMLALRCIQSQNPLPPDLMPVNLQYEAELLRPKEVGTILDFDHYSQITRDFDLEKIVAAIGDLHDNIDRAFRSAVTEQALKKWE